jgi:hypothetical protein
MHFWVAVWMLLFAQSVSAHGIINAAAHSPGTDVSHAVPGMTASWMSFTPGDADVQLAPLIVWPPDLQRCADHSPFFCNHQSLGGPDESATGHLRWFYEFVIDDAVTEPAFSLGLIRIDLDTPADRFFVHAWDAADGVRAMFFDADGHHIETLMPPHFEPAEGQGWIYTGTMQTSAPFSSVVFGGWDAASQFNSFGVPIAVPAPATIVVMGAGFAALVALRLRRSPAGAGPRRQVR